MSEHLQAGYRISHAHLLGDVNAIADIEESAIKTVAQSIGEEIAARGFGEKLEYPYECAREFRMNVIVMTPGERAELDNRIYGLQQTISGMDMSLDDLQTERDELARKLHHSQTEASHYFVRSSLMKEENERLEHEVNQAIDHLGDQALQNVRLERENDDLRDDNRMLRSENNALRDGLSHCREENNRLHRELDGARVENEVFRNQEQMIGNLSDENDQLRQTLEETSERLADAYSSIAHLRRAFDRVPFPFCFHG